MFDNDFEILNIPSNFYWLTKEKQGVGWKIGTWNVILQLIVIRWWIKTMAVCKRHKCWWLLRFLLLLLIGSITWVWPGLGVMKVLKVISFLTKKGTSENYLILLTVSSKSPTSHQYKNFLYHHPNICSYISLDKLIPLLCWLVLPCDCDNNTSTRQSTMSSPYLQFVF